MDEAVENGFGDCRFCDFMIPAGNRQPGGDDHVKLGEIAVEFGNDAFAMGDLQVGEQSRDAQVSSLEAFRSCFVVEGAVHPTLELLRSKSSISIPKLCRYRHYRVIGIKPLVHDRKL